MLLFKPKVATPFYQYWHEILIFYGVLFPKKYFAANPIPCTFDAPKCINFMFDNFWFNVQYGMNHVLDINPYDDILFLIVLTVPFVFKDWKRVLLLITMFTLGTWLCNSIFFTC